MRKHTEQGQRCKHSEQALHCRVQHLCSPATPPTWPLRPASTVWRPTTQVLLPSAVHAQRSCLLRHLRVCTAAQASALLVSSPASGRSALGASMNCSKHQKSCCCLTQGCALATWLL